MVLPVYTGKESKVLGEKSIILAGDVGATKTNLALFSYEKNILTLLYEERFSSKEYRNIIQIIEEFLIAHPLPDKMCFGVAGPVLNGRIKLSNIDWEIIDQDEISRHFGAQKVLLLNDLEATAYGLTMLEQKDIAVIHKGGDVAGGNAAVIAPGTGLGEAGLYWDGVAYHPFATEGGHCDFASRTAFDFELLTFLQKTLSHVSWERIVSGPGIVNIYQFLRDVKKREEPAWLKEKFENDEAPGVISQNVSHSELCQETMRHFIRYLAYESSNLVLKFKATGGLFIGGGIAPQIVSLFENNMFYASFCEIGRLHYLLEKIPVNVILNPKTALLGAAYYGANN
ncbi:MAG TPA: glucokinase [Saprospiraceae bacterium]|nr:glucokinase [Saprospiraceae bacterium]